VMECAKAKLHIVELLRQFDGREGWFNTTKLPLRDSGNQVIGVVGVSNDISTLRSAEQELINTNKELAFQYAEKERHAAELVVANVELAAQNVEIEEYSAELVATNKTLVFLAANLQLVHEKERVNLAREIHDGLAQLLVALKMDIGMYKKKISKTNEVIHTEEVIAEMEQLLIQVDNANKTARSIMNGLRPEQLELLGFVAAAEVHLSTFEQTHHIKCIFKNTVLDPIIQPDQALALFRILQESLNNILKHAMATRVTVRLTTIADKLVMEIRDNGIGFDVTRKCRSDSYGLIGMKERMKLLCGKLDITSKVGEGTMIRVEISFLHKCVENLN
jgi:signal transduction histidine kinase